MIRIGIECGQRWYSRYPGWRPFRTFESGFAIGTIMVWRESR